MLSMTATKEEAERVLTLLKDVRRKILPTLACRIHEGKWWWVSDEELRRPLTLDDVIELAKLRHPQFSVLFIVAESYSRFVDFRHLNCLPTNSVRYWPAQAVENKRAYGVHQPTVIVLTQTSSSLEEILKRRQAVVYRFDELEERWTDKKS